MARARGSSLKLEARVPVGSVVAILDAVREFKGEA
jgi:hypothetical protein